MFGRATASAAPFGARPARARGAGTPAAAVASSGSDEGTSMSNRDLLALRMEQALDSEFIVRHNLAGAAGAWEPARVVVVCALRDLTLARVLAC